MPGITDDDIARASRAKLTALNSGLVNAMAEVKLCEKQVAELQKKVAVIESRLASGSMTPTTSMILISQLDTTKQELTALNARLNTALLQISRYKDEMAKLPGQTKEAMTSNTIASMQENIAGLSASFSTDNPASVIDEMKNKIGPRSPVSELDLAEHDLVAEAEQSLKQTEVEDLLSTYKREIRGDGELPPRAPDPASEPAKPQEKTLGPSNQTLPPLD